MGTSETCWAQLSWYAEKFETPTLRIFPYSYRVAIADSVSRSEMAGLGQWIRYKSR